MMNRELVQVKDAQGNNLLHIAAKNRNEELFAFLLKRAGLNALTSKNNVLFLTFSSAGLHKIWRIYTEL
jgi:ankyrin repeat protein